MAGSLALLLFGLALALAPCPLLADGPAEGAPGPEVTVEDLGKTVKLSNGLLM